MQIYRTLRVAGKQLIGTAWSETVNIVFWHSSQNSDGAHFTPIHYWTFCMRLFFFKYILPLNIVKIQYLFIRTNLMVEGCP
jgi:hypothetical protein